MKRHRTHIGRNRLAVSLCTWPIVALILMGYLVDAPAARSSEKQEPKLKWSRKHIKNVPFVAFDCETTGLNPKKDRVVELAAVKYQDGKIVEEKTWLLNPGRSIPYWSTKVHGISNKMVRDQPRFKEIYPEFLAFIDDAILIAHNAPFDIAFIKNEVKRSNLALPDNLVLDSLGLFQRWFPELKSYSLQKVARHVKVDQGGYHRALADSIYIARIFDKGASKLERTEKLKRVYADAGGVLGF